MTTRFNGFLKAYVALAAAIAACVVLALTLTGCADESTWPESAEFNELDTGQARWSWHEVDGPGLGGWYVVVDRSTGAEYLSGGGGLCALVDSDGSPLTVLEAG